MTLRCIWSLLLAIGLGSFLAAQEKSPSITGVDQAKVPSEYKLEQPPNRGLDANLYIQISAEYRAACYQAFNLAELRVQQKLQQRAARLEQASGASQPNAKPPAVILDLDETVLDNYAFQTSQIRKGLAFDQKIWSNWEDHGQDAVGTIPGSVEFIKKIRELGVEPFYITNRNDRARNQTMAALKRFGIDVPEDQLLCANEETGSNKTSRRAKAAEKFDIILLVGDNLRDFDDAFRYDKEAGIDGRKKVVDNVASKFGNDWIILPNPAYGEWTKSFSNSELDKNLLLPPPEKP